MDLPVINPPIFPRWVWMEEITYSHIPIATLITAYMVLAPVYEWVGLRRGDPRFDRLAKGMIWFAMILFSPGAALGTGIAMWIMGTYPEFTSRWANLFFWPLMAQFGLFMAEVVFLFFGYYLVWDLLAHRKRLHIFLGVMAALSGLGVQFVWDALGAYMLTPSVPLPAVNEPVGWSAQAFFNPSFPYLFFHRFFGNISYVMLLTGAVFAMRGFRMKDSSEKAYFAWAANLMFTVGFLAFFAMPFLGWGYARVIQDQAPMAFHALMFGHTSDNLTVKMVLVALMVVIGAAYLFARYRAKAVLVAVTVGLASLYLVFHWHPPLRWFGEAAAWRAAYTGGLLALLAGLWLLARRLDPERPWWRWGMMTAGLAASTAFLIGGFIRERSKSPYTVYEELLKPEATQEEIERFEEYRAIVDPDAD